MTLADEDINSILMQVTPSSGKTLIQFRSCQVMVKSRTDPNGAIQWQNGSIGALKNIAKGTEIDFMT